MGADHDGSGRAPFMVLSEINSRMMDLWEALRRNSAAALPTSGSNLWRYNDFMSGEPNHCFESYVEVTTQQGSSFCWWLELTLTRAGWRFERRITEQTRDGEQLARAFHEYEFDRLDDFLGKYPILMNEFVESANSFEMGG